MRPIRRLLKRSLPRWTGLYVYRSLPQGVSVLFDLKRLVPDFKPKVVVDVGANIGEVAMDFVRTFPDANIYCVEPVTNTFNRLQENLEGHSRAQCFRAALGESSGQASMLVQEDSVYSRITDEPVGLGQSGQRTEMVTVETLTGFCAKHQIEHIDYLKIDTEGRDMCVLKGGAELFADGRISVLQVEAGMNRHNTLHVPYQEFVDYLLPFGFSLFGIYEQMYEAILGQPQLRRANPVFISEKMINRSDALA